MTQIELGVHAGPQDIELDELRRFWRFCDASGFDWTTFTNRHRAMAMGRHLRRLSR